MRIFLTLVILAAVGAGAAWILAGRADGPAIEIASPQAVIGQTGELAVAIEAPRGRLVQLDVALEQNGVRMPVFSLAEESEAQISREGEHRLLLTRPIGKRHVPELEAGAAQIIVTAARPVLFGYRQSRSTVTRDIEVRLTPPQISVQSTHHYINFGGSEMVVYRVRPADAHSGVRVGEREYAGFPASGAGIENADPALRVAFFALLWNQDVNTPIEVFARDAIGNEARATFDYRVFPKTFRKSRIQVDDRLLAKVVPSILAQSTELKVADPSDLLASYLSINRDLRRQNDATIAALAQRTAPEILWQGAFRQMVNTAVEAGFADQRTYVYKGEDVDHQVHLGFDLASTAAAPVLAANHGTVLYAGWLGIYGNCVILDHGMGLQSLYAHLSSIEVDPGDTVSINGRLGRSGATGLAVGDHLHFTMLLGGNPVTPIDWWSPQWVRDRILRKLREADAVGATGSG